MSNNKGETMLFRQGDLIMRRVGDAESTAPTRTLTLAVGEESGHSHVLDGVVVSGRVVDLPFPAALSVAGMPWRHDAIKLPSGRYEHWVQRELTEDEEMEEVRSVKD